MTENRTKRIGVLTSGGDSPGMNATIRAVVRAAISYGMEVYGIRRGYDGLIKGDMYQLFTRDVSEKLHAGGTFLMTARSEEFMTLEGREKAAEKIKIFGLDAVICIGGDGTFRGAKELSELGVDVIGIPATIDNDVACTEYTIGFDTALNTAMEAIDKLRDTSSSHRRCSVIQVMGRHAGYIAYRVGIASGAEVTLIPEIPFDINEDVNRLVLEGLNMGKHHFVVVVAEGAGSAEELAKEIEKATNIETRATVLGYIQRGGRPTIEDRYTASLMGIRAVECVVEGRKNRLVIRRNSKIDDIDIVEGLAMKNSITEEQMNRIKLLF
ncbi:MAG: 6-phosphofructokinase [Parasporobacterium sp.]|nr:6-phosphofructokinase [Parasporobacterium sp.]